MSRWGKNIVVPLDSLLKEKENNNRPTVARSVGTVGKWGKMGFTSTRTYTLSALPASVVAAAAAAVASSSPVQSPVSALEDDLSPSVPEPPKPKKFFKSRNTAPPEVIAQIIQQLPRAPTSPIRESTSAGSYDGVALLHSVRDPIKIKIPKINSAERKKKSPKKVVKQPKIVASDLDESVTDASPDVKTKKKKEEKKLKPEAPPSRIISRARKAVNYCEDDEDERIPTSLKDIIIPKAKLPKPEEPPDDEHVLPPPAAPANLPVVVTTPAQSPIAPKTPEHPPIVLRISKGTSRLVSTDSEEQPANSPQHETTKSSEPHKSSSRHTSLEDTFIPVALPAPVVLSTTPKIIVKPPKPPSPAPISNQLEVLKPPDDDEPPEINYCTVKISPDKPPKERLKLIIKTDVIRNAIAAAAAAEKAKAAAAAERAAATTAAETIEKPEKEKKQKNKKHKHPKHVAVEQLTLAVPGVEFKTPSPHLALGNSQQTTVSNDVQQASYPRTVISPPALSERDFDSQSSVLGSISSKGNSTPQPLAQTVQEESRVIHSRGSSVITSDLETSQHSSLVAPPSDIESRLESMMEGALEVENILDAAQKTALIQEEPLQEDILAVLRGDETLSVEDTCAATTVAMNGEVETENPAETEEGEVLLTAVPARRVTRGRKAGVVKANYVEEDSLPAKLQQITRPRGRKTAPTGEEPIPTKRATRRTAAKKLEMDPNVANDAAMEIDLEPPTKTVSSAEESTPTKPEKEVDELSTQSSLPIITTAPVRRGRPRSNNNNLNNNNNTINKIVADLSAKAGAAEEAAKITTLSSSTPVTTAPSNTRSYGRKRKNQQVTQVLQPPIDDTEHTPPAAKVASVDEAIATPLSIDLPSNDVQENNSTLSNQTPTMDFESNSDSNIIASHTENSNAEANGSPTCRDYRIKDKFKRTLMLDHQATPSFNCNAISGDTSPNTLSSATDGGTPTVAVEEAEQRTAVKLVISKKKGSIFKSRALVPDQAEQAAAKRSHLYKHRWDAEANGVDVNDDDTSSALNCKTDTAKQAPTRSVADAIFDDFSEDLSGGPNSRGNSPSLGKLTRILKPNPQTNNNAYDMNSDGSGEPGETISSVKVDRKAKDYYTVVRNVKSAHQIQEIGEYQEMDDDVEYILDALQPHNPTPTRCLSALQLATKCMTPAFRMHVRAHGVVTKFFKALSDANTDLSLGLCTTAIMFILSQEGLNMDLDRDSLELMMNLLEAEEVAAAPSDHANYERNKQKVRELCEEIKAQGKATHLNVDSITVGTLAMETLLSLTSKRAGEWFKEELRELGGLEHIIKTISDCCRPVIDGSIFPASSPINWTSSVLDNMKTVERCMRVMENVTQMNEENQKYMLTSYAGGAAVNTLCDLYRLCDRELMLYPTTDFTSKENPGIVIRELLIPLMKVLINLTHTFNSSNPLGAEILGKRPDVIETSFHILLQVPNYIPDHCVFELNILVLLLLINLTMYTAENRMLVMKTYAPPDLGTYYSDQHSKVPAIQSVMDYFYKCEELARLVEKNTDAILDCSDKNKKKQEEVDETVNNLLQKAGHHMEHTMKGSYAGILIGHLITDSEDNEAIVRTHLRGNGFKEIVSVLEKYYTFMNLTASSEASVVAHIKSTKKLIDYFKKRDLIYEMNDENVCALPSNTSTASNRSPSNAVSPTPTTRNTQRVYKTYSQR